MKFKEFKKIIKTYKQTVKQFDELYDLGFDFLENEKFPVWAGLDNLLMLTFESHYDEKGVDWINWFIYDNEYGTNGLTAYDGDLPICYDLKSLHECIKQYKKYEQVKTTQN
jgi:hypothetical protein